MKYSYKWIQSHIAEPLPAIEDLKQKIIFHAFEVENVETISDLHDGDDHDYILDIKVLPDRAGDCFSHYGMAREIAGLCNLSLKSSSEKPLPEKVLSLPVEITHEACKRYIAIAIEGVKVGPSPDWLAARLAAVGQKSINNIVDITNFIMLDTGQPVHAFDRNKIDGGIAVRLAREGEKVITLSDEEKVLHETDVVIADYLGVLAIAGVKGGKSAQVDEQTTSIVLEIANFDAGAVRKTARGLNLITDASRRFENTISPEVAYGAAQKALALMGEYAQGEVVGVKDIYPNHQNTRTLSFAVADIARLLGEWVTAEKVEEVFHRYAYEFTFNEGVFALTVPVYRADIYGAHDIAEEIGRVLGYDQVVSKALPFTLPVVVHEIDKTITAVKHYLGAQGFSEVMNYSFCKKGDVYVAHGSKDKSALRTNLSEGLKKSYDNARLQAPVLGWTNVKLFEVGTVFLSEKEEIHVATVDDGVMLELSLDQFVASYDVLKDINASDMRLENNPNPFIMWSVYPFISRDIAVWVASSVDKSRLEDILNTFAKEFCVRAPYKIDEFAKEGKTSVAFRLVFQAYNRTLTEEDVRAWWGILEDRIKSEKTFEIR